MVNRDEKFLFDENVPVKLKQIFNENDYSVDTVQELGWSGIKNGELSNRTSEQNYILDTRDRDFIHLWEKYELRVVYLAIHPPILKKLSPRVNELLLDWKNEENPFLIIVQDDIIRIWKK